jgi:predicted transcriptional regulator
MDANKQVDITDEMIEAAAEQIYGGPVHRFKVVDDEIVEYTVTWSEVVEKVGQEEREIYLRKARRILQAALAGRPVVEPAAMIELRDRLAEYDRRRARVDTGAIPFSAITVIEAARRLAGSVGSEVPAGDPS